MRITMVTVSTTTASACLAEVEVLVAGDPAKVRKVLAEYRKILKRWNSIDQLSSDATREEKEFFRAWKPNFLFSKSLAGRMRRLVKFLEDNGLKVIRPSEAGIKIF